MIKNFDIKPLSKKRAPELQQKIDQKTKPLGALGRLEEIALSIGCLQNTLSPVLKEPTLAIFAGDHGITAEGVSPYPQAVTYQMVFNFIAEGAAINVFAKQHHLNLIIIDAGVNYDFADSIPLVHAKISKGTKNFLTTAAMTKAQCQQALQKGAEIVAKIQVGGCNTIGFGEMGIGNTSSAAALMHLLTNIPLENCVGKGTGLNDQGVQHKLAILKQAIKYHAIPKDPFTALMTFGGFEIAMMVGGYLRAAELGMLILVDGFITTVALLVASQCNPLVLDYCLFTHQSQEKGHTFILNYLKANPISSLDMRLGEGTGIAVTFPIIQSAVRFLNEMASFDSAKVSTR